MMFSKTKNVSKIIRITQKEHNLLGGCFSESDKTTIQLIEIERPGDKIQISANQVLEEELSGLKKVNESLGKNYQLSKIYFLSLDSAFDSIYEFLIQKLIRHYDQGNKFKKVQVVH